MSCVTRAQRVGQPAAVRNRIISTRASARMARRSRARVRDGSVRGAAHSAARIAARPRPRGVRARSMLAARTHRFYAHPLSTRFAHGTPATRGQEMAEEAFDSLDEAAVAGAHGLGWGPLLSPIDVLSFGNMDALLKPQIPLQPVPLAPHAAPQHTSQHAQQQHAPVPLAPAPGPAPHSLPPSVGLVKREVCAVKRRAVPRKRNIVVAPPMPPGHAPRRLSRAEEALEYGALADIGGTTAARSRQMSEEERRVMLYKRKLRNRASAARSREKRCRTIMELSKEVQALLDVSTKLRSECNARAAENDNIFAENKKLKAENDRLRDLLSQASLSTTQL